MNRVTRFLSMALMGLVVALGGCAGGAARQGPSSRAGEASYPVATPASPPPPAVMGGEAESQADATTSAPARSQAPVAQPGGASADTYAQARKSSEAPARDRALEPKAEARPGLGTAWGETRESHTTEAAFVRDNPSTPFSVAAVYYNDREGANAMARASDYRRYDRGVVPVMGGALTVSLRDDSGSVLPGFSAGGRQYAIGEPGQRYVLIVQNNTGFRYECVATVDGLDVIDGRAGSFSKRGYLIQPYGTLEIDGFRRSADAVASFRFSSVRGSYASRSGQGDQNVGVIGIALFNERGTRPTWTQDEINRRHNADPFPGRYATPPTN